jgi:hypothetical protein
MKTSSAIFFPETFQKERIMIKTEIILNKVNGIENQSHSNPR